MSSPTTTSSLDYERVTTHKAQWDAADLITRTLGASPPALGSFGATEQDRNHLIAHMGRKTLQACPTRDLKRPGTKTQTAPQPRSSTV